MEQFGSYLRRLRKEKGLTLKQVEKAAKVSNAYMSLVERGRRNPPHPDILRRLAKVYEVSQRELLVAAGYLEDDPSERLERAKVEQAYQHVINDPTYRHGTRLKGSHLSLEAKRFIVELYERTTGRQVLITEKAAS
jgi:HTH-type transcriptional regulator, competence development regulator